MLTLGKHIHVTDIDLWLDPGIKKPFAFVSHGHSDHIRRHERVLLSPETALFYADRYKKPSDVWARAFNEPFSLNGSVVELFPSGHMLGSAQICIEGEQRVVYTGDFKLEPGGTSRPAQIKHCDILIMECTYGQPRYVFPPREEVNDRILRFVEGYLNAGFVPVLYAYSLGKAQEAMKLIGDRNLPMVVSPSVYRTAKLYEQAGVIFNRYDVFEGGPLKDTVLIGPRTIKRQGLLEGIRKKRTATLTGWALDGPSSRFGSGLSFPLSDHADFNDLLEYARRAEPLKIITLHGPAGFAAHLRRAGFDAIPFPSVSHPG